MKEPIAKRIIAAALSIVGEEEIKNNAGFKDPLFEQKMRDMGWTKGWAWCAFTAELIWKTAYGKDSMMYGPIDRLFSPSAIATHVNFRGSNDFKTGVIPKPGALVIWRMGNGWHGHIGVVVAVSEDGKTFDTVEGNSNDNPDDNEGIKVVHKKGKKVGLPFRKDKLNFEGFVYPAED